MCRCSPSKERPGSGAEFFDHGEDAVGVDAEFVFLLAGGGVFVGVRVDVGVDPQAETSPLAELGGEHGDPFELAFGFDVEAPHGAAGGRIGQAEDRGLGGRKRAIAPVERRQDLGIAFADPGENDVGHRRARKPGPLELAARNHVHAGTERTQEAAKVEVGAGLDRVMQVRVQRSERRRQTPISRADRPRRIDISRSPGRRGNPRHRNLVGMKMAVTPSECLHQGSIKRSGRSAPEHFNRAGDGVDPAPNRSLREDPFEIAGELRVSGRSLEEAIELVAAPWWLWRESGSRRAWRRGRGPLSKRRRQGGRVQDFQISAGRGRGVPACRSRRGRLRRPLPR